MKIPTYKINRGYGHNLRICSKYIALQLYCCIFKNSKQKDNLRTLGLKLSLKLIVWTIAYELTSVRNKNTQSDKSVYPLSQFPIEIEE